MGQTAESAIAQPCPRQCAGLSTVNCSTAACDDLPLVLLGTVSISLMLVSGAQTTKGFYHGVLPQPSRRSLANCIPFPTDSERHGPRQACLGSASSQPPGVTACGRSRSGNWRGCPTHRRPCRCSWKLDKSWLPIRQRWMRAPADGAVLRKRWQAAAPCAPWARLGVRSPRTQSSPFPPIGRWMVGLLPVPSSPDAGLKTIGRHPLTGRWTMTACHQYQRD